MGHKFTVWWRGEPWRSHDLLSEDRLAMLWDFFSEFSTIRRRRIVSPRHDFFSRQNRTHSRGRREFGCRFNKYSFAESAWMYMWYCGGMRRIDFLVLNCARCDYNSFIYEFFCNYWWIFQISKFEFTNSLKFDVLGVLVSLTHGVFWIFGNLNEIGVLIVFF